MINDVSQLSLSLLFICCMYSHLKGIVAIAKAVQAVVGHTAELRGRRLVAFVATFLVTASAYLATASLVAACWSRLVPAYSSMASGKLPSRWHSFAHTEAAITFPLVATCPCP